MAKGVTNFEDEMASAIAAAKSKKVPVGGVEMPKMPRLDQAPPSNQGVQSVRAAQKILTPEQQKILKDRGELRQGIGAAYAVNQPSAKPVITDEEDNVKEIDPRLEPRPEGAGLRNDTIKALEAVAEANAKTDDDKELDAINKEIDDIDEVYETDEFGQRVRSLLQNKKRKAAIEARASIMSFEDLLLNGSVTQKVPIIPNQFEPTFRSLYGDEDIEIKRLMGQVKGPDQYILDLFSVYNLTAGLYAINNRPLPSHLNKDGDFDEKLFREKFKVVSKMSIAILADLSVNFSWFTRRVQKLTVIDDIKGF